LGEKKLTAFGLAFKPEPVIETLRGWQPGMKASELAEVTEAALNFSAPSTRKRYRSEIFRFFVPLSDDRQITSQNNEVAKFVQIEESCQSNVQALLYQILRRHPTILAVSSYIRNDFADVSFTTSNIVAFLKGKMDSPKGPQESAQKILSLLKHFGCVADGEEMRPLLRTPEPKAFGYMLYDFCCSRQIVAPSIEDIVGNPVFRACFLTESGMLDVLKKKDGSWWHWEKASPMNRIVLKFRSLDEFLKNLSF